MNTVNSIGGATLSAAVAAEKAVEPKQTAPAMDGTNAELDASVAAYLSLPGFNAPSQIDVEGGNTEQANALKAVSESDDDGLKQALKEFDDGLKRLVQRPETQFFQAKFGVDAAAENLPAPEPLPGVGEDGLLRPTSGDYQAADTNHDGKISEEELSRYQAPLTYRSSEAAARVDALVDGPSAFSLVEANRAYGVVSAAAATA